MSENMKDLQSSAEVRAHLVAALRADLVGPFSGDDDAEEVWDLAPSKRYLCGFLVPREQAKVEDEEDDDPSTGDELGAGNDPGQESQNDPQAKRRPMLPSSIGLSVLLPGDGDSILARVSYADYLAEAQEVEADDQGKKKRGRPPIHWRRAAREPIELTVALDSAALRKGIDIADSGLRLFGQLENTEHIDGLPDGTRAVSIFVVNDRSPNPDKRLRDQAYVFQVCLELRHEQGLVPRPDLAGRSAKDWDDKVMDLQFRDQHSFAAGHGVSVVAIAEEGNVVGAKTEWIPQAKVKRVTVGPAEGVEVAMERLAELDSAKAVRAALGGIPELYGAWLANERSRISSLDERRRQVAESVLTRAEQAKRRIAEGIDLLAENAEARRAFDIANTAMAMAARKRSPERYTGDEVPSWRLFQLAFVLMNLPAVVDPEHEDRETVELIFFPTGGGKTEAYLGVIAFTLVWRRMTATERPDRGLGVAVLLRYTLRLLTLDQLGRAATLICALELLRGEHDDLGDVRFSLGLWVGKSATANRLSTVAKQISEYRNRSTKLSPFPLPACPWCHEEIEPTCMKVSPNQKSPVEVEGGCRSYKCEFSPRNGGLPVIFVDEQIYRELPSFLVATVDKFAMLPWRGESGALFGQVQKRIGRTFVGPSTPAPKGTKGEAVKLPEGLRPPELIIQDELHLISGPLGTMVGLYETAVEQLSVRRTAAGASIKPKLIASTATVKRAQEQIAALYGREEMAMFPPPGLDDSESFFAQVDTEANGRLYLGVAAAGRSAKAVLVTVYAALLSAAQKCIDPEGSPGQPGDPYMTLVGYFNNLRELGGMRRLVEDLIRARAANRGELKPLGIEENPWMANRVLKKAPIELTSRESTSAISNSKDMLGRQYLEEGFIPTVLASNMISVGIDIDRLGLMVVAGQPKSTSEYIQASSRVGRDDKRPGLVVTCYNLNKPRDRSYYEHFVDYHECFYRHVEATSVTPFSGPALERGLAGALIAMTRHGVLEMSPPTAAMDLDAHRAAADRAVEALVTRAVAQPNVGGRDEEVELALRSRAQQVIDDWIELIAVAKEGGPRCYSPYDIKRTGNPMLQTALDAKRAEAQGLSVKGYFVAPTSMRDVEPTVHLWLQRAGGWGRSDR